MQFNPETETSDGSIIKDIDFLLFGDSSTFNTDYSLADRTRNVNISYDEIVAELYKADPNYTWDDTNNSDFPVATVDMTSGLDHYSLLDSSAVVWRVRMKDSTGNYQTLDPKLKSEFTDSELDSSGTPYAYYKIGQAIFPVPVPNYGATAGVELTFQRGGNHFSTTDTTKEPGFNPQFHQFLSVGACLRYAIANGMRDKVSFLNDMKNNIKIDISEHYARRSPDDRTRLQLKKKTSNYGLVGGFK